MSPTEPPPETEGTVYVYTMPDDPAHRTDPYCDRYELFCDRPVETVDAILVRPGGSKNITRWASARADVYLGNAYRYDQDALHPVQIAGGRVRTVDRGPSLPVDPATGLVEVEVTYPESRVRGRMGLDPEQALREYLRACAARERAMAQRIRDDSAEAAEELERFAFWGWQVTAAGATTRIRSRWHDPYTVPESCYSTSYGTVPQERTAPASPLPGPALLRDVRAHPGLDLLPALPAPAACSCACEDCECDCHDEETP